MKGIILAGGSGSRLFPATAAVNKQLLPIHDKPMIFYPLTSLLAASIDDICIVCNALDVPGYLSLLGDGSQFGASITYVVQEKPEGIPQALVLASKFIGAEPVSLILGDNIFVDNGDIRRAVSKFSTGAHIFGLQVKRPENYGVVVIDDSSSPVALVEKPRDPKSNLAIPGFYIFDQKSSLLAQSLVKSKRNEYEIVDLLRLYLKNNELGLTVLSRGTGWIDAGTTQNYAIVSRYIEAMQQMHGIMLGSPHEAALVRGFIDCEHIKDIAASMKASEYKDHLEELITGQIAQEKTVVAS